MKEQLIIYGCYGYTGRLIVEEAIRCGLKPILSGRNFNKVNEMAVEFNLSSRPFELHDEAEVISKLHDCKVLLNCAGPFIHTAHHLCNACIQTGTHYLDITGEYQIFEELQSYNNQAELKNVIVMPGVGFDVVPSDCLASLLKKELPTADKLELCLMMDGGRISHGTALTVLENLGTGTIVRKNGKMIKTPSGSIQKKFEINNRKVNAVAISWGDVSTAWVSTKIPNITVYNALPPKLIKNMKWTDRLGFLFRIGFIKKFLQSNIKSKPVGPDPITRKNAKTYIYGEVKNNIGAFKRYTLELPEGYSLTATTAIDISRKILNNEVKGSGFYTPSLLLGEKYIFNFEGVKLISQNIEKIELRLEMNP